MKKDYLIIDRSKWRSGGSGEGETKLLNDQGYMCCLGFRCEQMGIPKKDLLGKIAPMDLAKKWNIPDLLEEDGGFTTLTSVAINVNDKQGITQEQREKKIIACFAKSGITVEFKGKYNE